MSNASDFIMENGVLMKYVGPGGDVVIPESVTAMNGGAFKSCRSLRSVVLPSRISALPNSAFSNCTSLCSITLPEGLREIGWRAFYGCTDLTEIVIPDTVTFLQKDAFTACSSLKSVILPHQEIRMSSDAFLECPQLRYIYAPWLSLARIKVSVNKRAAAVGFLCNQNSYDPALAEEYMAFAARQRKQIVPILLADDRVAGIAAYARMGKITMKNVDEAFLQPAIEAGATECTAFLMDWSVENISPEDRQRQLLRELEKNPFNIEDMRVLWSYEPLKDGTLMITGYKGEDRDIVIPPQIGKRKVTAIGPRAFSASRSGRTQKKIERLRSITSVTIPEEVTEIGPSAFAGCCGLTEVNLPSGLKSVPYDCFNGCESLTRITIPAGIKAIDSYAFYNCDGLKEVHIPASVEKIKGSAFNCCWYLTIYAPAGSCGERFAKEKKKPFVEE